MEFNSINNDSINVLEKLVSNPKYQNLLDYDIRTIIKILKLEQCGFDITVFNDDPNMKMSSIDVLLYCFERNYIPRPVKPVLTKVPFAEDGVHGTKTYNDKGELVGTEFVVDTDTDTEADGCDSDVCEFDSEPEPDQIPVEPAPKRKEYFAMKLLDKKIAEAKEEEGSSNLSFTQMF